MAAQLKVYISRTCLHSRAVEKLLQNHEIEAEYIRIDGNAAARQELMALNNGYASVPTLLFADGTQMTEPALSKVRAKLGLPSDGWLERVLKSWQGK